MVYDFWASKVRPRISDPAKREILEPEPPYPFATKRSSLEQSYYECLERDSVEVVSLTKTPIRGFDSQGLVTDDGKEKEHDVVIFATGFDNMTGSLTEWAFVARTGMGILAAPIYRYPGCKCRTLISHWCNPGAAETWLAAVWGQIRI